MAGGRGGACGSFGFDGVALVWACFSTKMFWMGDVVKVFVVMVLDVLVVVWTVNRSLVCTEDSSRRLY